MTVRELPPEEWSRLEGTELGTTWGLLSPEQTIVLVVEDKGVIVGTWAIMPVIHAEGLGVMPQHQHKGHVARLLLRAGAEVVRRLGAASFVTGAQTDEMSDYITRMGGQRWPCAVFTVPLTPQFDRVTGAKESQLCPQE